MSRRRIGFRNIRHPEQLETRAMLAGNGFMPFAFAGPRFLAGAGPRETATQFVSSAIAGHLEGGPREFGAFHSHSTTDSASFTATLTDAEGTATGTAAYSTKTVDGETGTTFSVDVTGATANTTFDVTVGDTVVGQLTTDDTGTGSLVLSSNPTGSEQQLPENFPTDIGADTAISVGSLSGTLAADTGSGDDGGTGGGCHASHHVSLGASLTDATNAASTGTATYKFDAESGDTTFTVSVKGATASSTLDVAVDGTVVGQLVTDETGAGSLTLSSNPTGTEQALPVDFPTNISAGSTITVGTLTGTFSSNTSSATDAYFSGLHFARRH